jgi:methionyl-tRNA formyltransferase
MKAGEIVILSGPLSSTAALYNFLKPRFKISQVIIEKRPSRGQMLLRRARRLGWSTATGQLLFRISAVPILEFTSRTRIRQIQQEHGLNYDPIPGDIVTRVESVNSPEAILLLRELQPSVVLVNGTRIISEETLRTHAGKFINLHAGITPRYRGVHGAYWALAEGHKDLCGCTVHMIDSGIDTGAILAQAKIEPQPDDNFVTYPTLQLAAGMKLLPAIMAKFIAGQPPAPVPGCQEESKLWSHPTLPQYLRIRRQQGVK